MLITSTGLVLHRLSEFLCHCPQLARPITMRIKRVLRGCATSSLTYRYVRAGQIKSRLVSKIALMGRWGSNTDGKCARKVCRACRICPKQHQGASESTTHTANRLHTVSTQEIRMIMRLCRGLAMPAILCKAPDLHLIRSLTEVC